MKPAFRDTRTPDLSVTQGEIGETFDQFGELSCSLALGPREIATVETPIPHGQGIPPRWIAHDKQGPGDIWQSKAPDRQFLYLIASVAVTASVTVF